MNLAIFDIDGTLTETDHVDGICFLQALSDAHGMTNVSSDWAGYPHTTDSAILSYVFQEQLNRPPEQSELQKFKTHFVSLLEDYRASDCGRKEKLERAGATHVLKDFSDYEKLISCLMETKVPRS